VGWTKEAFVLPHKTIRDSNGQRVIFQTEGALRHQYATTGSLEHWQNEIARFAVGNSRLVLSISSALVGPSLPLLGEEGGGLHFRGGSSIGKSTALIAAVSVWGPPELMRQWRSTANALEGVCVLHNETFLALDEIGQLDPKEAGSVGYLIANGKGKARSGR
ncbi:MAG: DUF927 domain-containing protein, partial [Pseudomonadota bacterium]